MGNNKIRFFYNKFNKNIFFPKYTFTVVERGNPHSPDSFLHVDKKECTSNMHLSWHLHFEAHTEQHLQAEHGQICRSHPSHEEVWDIYMFSSPRVSKINFLIHVLESFFTTPAMSLSVVLSARVKPSYRIWLNPCLPSLAQRPASCQYDRIDFGQPIWTTSYTSRISNPIPKATVAIMHRIRLLPLLNSVSILSLESWCVLL